MQRSRSGSTRTIIASVAAVAVVAFAVVWIFSSGDDSSSGAAAGGGQRQVIVDQNFDLVTADPGRMYEVTGGTVDRALYDTLTTVANGDAAKAEPLLATEWEPSDGARRWTFTLRDDVVFSDGTGLTSADVLFSFNRLANIKGNPAFLTEGLTFTAPDPGTFVVESESPRPDIPLLVTYPSFGVVNSKVVKENGGTDAEDADKTDTAERFLNGTSVGSGPYILESYEKTSQVVLRANESYWGETPSYTRVVLRNVPPETQSFDLQRGEAQVALSLSSEQAAELDEARYDVQVGPSAQTLFAFVNADPKVSRTTANPDIWEAIRYGIDYDGVASVAVEGARPAAGVIPTSVLGGLPQEERIERDVARARAAVERSGIDNPTIELEWPSDLFFSGIDPAPVAQRVQSNLEEVGITLELKPSPLATSLPHWREAKSQMAIWDIVPDTADPTQFLTFLPGQTYGLRAGWSKGSDKQLEALGDEARATDEPSARERLYHEIQRRLNESSPFFPLVEEPRAVVTDGSVTGVDLYALPIVKFDDWRPAS